MRWLTGTLFWLGLFFTLLIAGIAVTDNAIPEILLGLIAPERVFLTVLGFVSLAFIGLSLILRRRRDALVPKWRLMILAICILTAMVCLRLSLSPGFSITDVTFASEGVNLKASLYLPPGADPVVTLVLVPGSAPAKGSFYDVYARRLAAAGFGVLVTDKRGAGESGGVFVSDNNGSKENLTLLARDVVAGVEYLSQHARIDHDKIGLFGISQAGWVAPLAAEMAPAIKYMVLITAPTVSVGEESVWSDLQGDYEGDPIVGTAEAKERISTTDTSGFDPRGLLNRLTIPALWLYGDMDYSIPSHKSIEVLESIPNELNDYILYPGYGHLLLGAGEGGGSMWNIAPQSWQDILDWLGDIT